MRVSTLLITLFLTLSAPALVASQSPAVDLTGTWTGKFTIVGGDRKEEGAHAVLKQEGTEISGTVGPSAQRQFPINKGVVKTTKEGTTVVFDTGRAGHVITFELTLVDGRLTGPARDEFYPNQKSTVELQRAKEQ